MPRHPKKSQNRHCMTRTRIMDHYKRHNFQADKNKFLELSTLSDTRVDATRGHLWYKTLAKWVGLSYTCACDDLHWWLVIGDRIDKDNLHAETRPCFVCWTQMNGKPCVTVPSPVMLVHSLAFASAFKRSPWNWPMAMNANCCFHHVFCSK